jgi:hypothetical protein
MLRVVRTDCASTLSRLTVAAKILVDVVVEQAGVRSQVTKLTLAP